MSETTTSDAVLARLETLTARLDQQAAEIAGLKAENTRLAAAQAFDARSAPRPDGDTAVPSADAPGAKTASIHGGRRAPGAGVLKRRGLLAGVVALAGAGLAKLAGPGRAEATHGSGVDPAALHVGEENTATKVTSLTRSAGSVPLQALRVTNENASAAAIFALTINGTGILGRASSVAADPHWGVVGQVGDSFPVSFFDRPVAVYGASPDYTGVMGDSRDAPGVVGRSTGSGGAPGVLGQGGGPNGAGVVGLQPGVATPGGNVGAGVYGSGVGASQGASGYGVFGDTDSASNPGTMGRNQGNGPGVRGVSPNGVGVQGTSTNNAGVYGVGPIGVFATGTGTAAVYGASNGTYGVWGNSGASAGLIGTSTSYIGVEAVSTSHWGLRAKSPNYAGVFEGNVFVTGQVIALGGVVGASAQAATRATAEDVGEATLANGRATVTLDQDFADAANGEYRVFLTELADLGGLYVVRKGPREFEVRSRGGAGQAAANGRFDYRVVAQTAGPRQAPPAPPDLTTVKPAPKPPEPPKASEPGASDERRQR